MIVGCGPPNPFARPDLHRAVVLASEHDEVQDLAPEPRQHLRLAATEHELTDTTRHERNVPSAWERAARPGAGGELGGGRALVDEVLAALRRFGPLG